MGTTAFRGNNGSEIAVGKLLANKARLGAESYNEACRPMLRGAILPGEVFSGNGKRLSNPSQYNPCCGYTDVVLCATGHFSEGFRAISALERGHIPHADGLDTSSASSFRKD